MFVRYLHAAWLCLVPACSALAVEHGRSTRALDEIGTSLGAAKGTIHGVSGSGIAAELFGQETILGPNAGVGLRAGYMVDSAANGSFTGWYAMPIFYLGLKPEVLYARFGLGWIFSGNLHPPDGVMLPSDYDGGAMGIRAMAGVHLRLIDTGSISYRFYLDGMATTTTEASLGDYSGVALVGGFLFAFTANR